MSYSEQEDGDLFHKCFKFYKSNKNIKDEQILDVRTLNKNNTFITDFPLISCKNVYPGLKPISQWKGYTFNNHSGLMWLSNLMTPQLERYLVRRCLCDLIKKPNKTNLDNYTKEEDIDNIWINNSKKENKQKLLKKLRWVTMGYHHNWDTKLYTEENKSEMPQDILELTKCIAGAVGFSNFVAEAGIINIYHKNSSLAGHIDNSEFNLSSPIISISLGCTGIFLIGGPNKSSEPTALYVRSGDVIVMSGEARVCYHAVPCIITNSYEESKECDRIIEKKLENNSNLQPYRKNNLLSDCYDRDDWHLFKEFLNISRINLNTRQVHNTTII